MLARADENLKGSRGVDRLENVGSDRARIRRKVILGMSPGRGEIFRLDDIR